ncbi:MULTISPECIES: MBL fold metallo-hydrolase [unclassified Nocardioides]|uniref:MBL fold metallo-hydrolase n=1 Tax=unclassified Nocardioides TaxID=2615069 RepID=UPI0000574ADF|nr:MULTISPECIES: MBL fold metallo-hydrolase [unclassified Nocardioides]ABL80692.1 beta-lactamase domain protein [Nocardioides sp. JS614]
MQRVTPHVFTSTTIRGCNPSYVVTTAGVVLIDTPQLPTKALEMRKQAEAEGPIRFVINTEHHVDHIFGNYFFKGAGEVVHHQGVADNFMVPTPDLDPFAYAIEAIPTDDPEAAAIVPDRDTYYEDPNRGDLVFTGDLDLKVGEKTFHLIHTPGHTPGQVAVYVPDERVVFTGDTVFSQCQTWLMTSDVEQWVGALDVIGSLEVDTVVPGHGPVTTPDYLATQRAVLLEWTGAVAEAVALGWSREETIARIDFRDKFGPVDIGQGYMMDHIQTLNAASLWDKFTTKRSPAR